MSVEVLVALALLLLFSVLALLLWNWKSGGGSREKRAGGSAVDADDAGGGTDCPLCGERLPRGTRVSSVVYPGKEFDLMRIYGCPFCREGAPEDGISPASASPARHRRRCPYCGAVLPPDGYVMAQVYRKPYRKPHVHVYGCTVCKPGRG